MKVLQGIPSNRVTGIDIETVRVVENFDDLDEGTQSAWEYKNKQDGEVPEYEDLKEKWSKNASLYAEFSKVCAVSLVFLHEDKLYCKEFYGENEKELLMALSISLNNMEAQSRDYRLVGHAAKYFDYPFLCKRYIINGLDIPGILDTTLLKPWENKNLCTNELWKVAGTGAGSSLQALCNVLGLPVSKVDLVGDGVGKAYFDKELERIGHYCSLDTIATFNIVRRFKKESIFSFDEVTYVKAYTEQENQVKELIEEQPLLVKLYNSKQFTDEVKEELKSLKITKKDKPVVQKLVLAHYKEQIDVMAFNKKELQEINKKRTEEITEFFKTL